MTSKKTIFHLALDQFSVAVELLRQPHLRGKPVAVGVVSGRSHIISSSRDACRAGVCPGMKVHEALACCPDLVVLPPDMPRYLEVSRRVMELLLEFSDRVEPIAVDEAYLDMTAAIRHANGVESVAEEIKRRILESEGLTVSIGAGPNRVVAKIAGELRRPDGFTYIPPDRISEAFRDLPVSSLDGVGKATQTVLESFGIRTIGQLAAFPRDPLRRRFGKWGEELIRLAGGRGNEEVLATANQLPERSIGYEYTFSRDLSDANQIRERLRLIAERVGRRLRAARLAAGSVTLKLRYHEFDSFTHGRKLRRYLLSESEIYAAGDKLFTELFDSLRPVRLIGIYVSQLVPLSQISQQELFEAEPEATSLGSIRDEIQERFGEQTINYADVLRPKKRAVRRKGGRGADSDPLLGYSPSRPPHSGVDENTAPPAGSER